ncbi:YraN family protein [Acaryochloris sp. IP29b_bin.148]|uniref:YraN family protein n=1 Tax=Acaryochloris sp. IP29b_bin.148 TaxID=2969218 RepID=UPI0026235452|nr:YraN family protein [Acaryochloris sp. IP29b_bin.148]
MTSPQSRPQKPSHTAQTGQWGEQLVCQWLKQQQWQILAHRWHCRWGEIDIIARSPNSRTQTPAYIDRLAFVEVKTRQSRNWDADGRLAITPQKQQKLWKTAQLFLSQHPHLYELSCQFDVALVQCNKIRGTEPVTPPDITDVLASTPIHLNCPLQIRGYQLRLLDYIESAFTL